MNAKSVPKIKHCKVPKTEIDSYVYTLTYDFYIKSLNNT